MDYDVGGVCIALERNELAGFADTKTIFSFMSFRGSLAAAWQQAVCLR